MEPILCCECCDHLYSNIPTNRVMSPQDLLRGMVVSRMLLCRMVLHGLARRLQSRYFGPLRWPGPQAKTLYRRL
jgi:hypothetical protein